MGHLNLTFLHFMPARKQTTRKSKTTSEQCNSIEKSLSFNWSTDFTIKNNFHLNPLHKGFKDCCMADQTKIAFVDGPAGTAKSYLAVLSALQCLKEQKVDSIIYIRSVIESASRSIGALPGEIDDKFGPYAMPLMEKVTEICGDNVAAILKSHDVLSAVPVNFVRGLTFNRAFVIVDEAQNLTKSELVTILTRFGKDTRYAICGDKAQSDIGKLSGFTEIFDAFAGRGDANGQGIYNFKFGQDEIVRSKILRYIVQVLGA